MIQQFFNGMLALMLAKFMLNDVPHTLRINSPRGAWVESAWARLCSTTNIAGISLAADYDRDPIPKLKIILGGYFLIATESAPDRAVDDTFGLLVSLVDAALYKRVGAEEPGNAIIRLQAEGEYVLAGEVVSLSNMRSALANSITRGDKVIAIDSVVSMMHERGRIILILFGIHDWTPLADSVMRTLDLLATMPGAPEHTTVSEYEVERTIRAGLGAMAKKYDIPTPLWKFVPGPWMSYRGGTIYIPDEYTRVKDLRILMPLSYFLAHEFAHYMYDFKGTQFKDRVEEEAAARKLAGEETFLDREAALLTLREVSPRLYRM